MAERWVYYLERFLGGLGAHRFYTGYTGTGILQLIITLLTFIFPIFGLIGIWVIIDLIYIIMDKWKNADGSELVK